MTVRKISLMIGPVSPAAPGALYQQIVNGLQREISEGRLTPGSALPSFRQLAEELRVSLITVKRAYEELERAGIVYSRQGLGTFVAEEGDDRSRRAKLESARRHFQAGLQEALEAGLSIAEAQALVQAEMKSRK
jgi:GntR family transcriptional regulator